MMRTNNWRVIVLLGVLSACHSSPEGGNTAKEPEKNDSVKAVVAVMDTARKTISLPGELLPYEQVLIRAKVPGYIRRLNVDIGSVVRKGQELALVDAPEVNTRVQEMNEKMNAARSRYAASKDYYDRIALAAKADGVVAASELARVQNQMLADSAEYSAARLSAASFREIGGYLAVIAPSAGIISKRNIVVGSFVGTAGDSPLFELENNSMLRLQVPVPEVYTNSVLRGQAGELTTRSLPDTKFAAKLVRKAGSIDHETRSEVWEFEIPNADRVLKPGSYADVKLSFLRARPSVVVPVSAVVTTLERRFVIRVAGGVSQWVDVRPGFNMGDRVEVFGDLKAGDTLVLRGIEELKAGTKVVPALTK